MCYTAVVGWTESPVTTSIDNTAAPVKELDYPSVTTCRAIPYYQSSWEIPSLIFNALKFTDAKEPNVLEARKTFQPFVGNVTKHLMNSLCQMAQFLLEFKEKVFKSAVGHSQ